MIELELNGASEDVARLHQDQGTEAAERLSVARMMLDLNRIEGDPHSPPASGAEAALAAVAASIEGINWGEIGRVLPEAMKAVMRRSVSLLSSSIDRRQQYAIASFALRPQISAKQQVMQPLREVRFVFTHGEPASDIDRISNALLLVKTASDPNAVNDRFPAYSAGNEENGYRELERLLTAPLAIAQ